MGDYLRRFWLPFGLASELPASGRVAVFRSEREKGLRCAYHRWKFNASGSCVKMPNEPTEPNFKHKVKVAAYPCEEWGDILWTYLGPEGLGAQIPELEWM